MVLGAIGAAVGASGTAAVVVGGAIVGAVAGAAIAAVKGDNILDGALKGGLIGAFGGYMGASLGLAGNVGAYGAETATLTSGEALAAGSASGGEAMAGATGASQVGSTAGLTSGETMLQTAALKGAGAYYEGKEQSEAVKEAARIQAAAQQQSIDRMAATPAKVDPLTSKVVTTPWSMAPTSAPGAVAAPSVSQVGAATVQPGTVQAGFDTNLRKPPITAV